MANKVTNIRDGRGRFPKGVSGNPSGVSARHAAIKQMLRENEVVLTSLITEMVPHAAKLHRALLKNGKDMTAKETLQLIALTYEYGIGKPRPMEAPAKQIDEAEFTIDDMPEEKRQAIIEMLTNTAKDAFTK